MKEELVSAAAGKNGPGCLAGASKESVSIFQGQRKDKYELGDVGGDPIVLEVQLAVAVERSGIVEEVRVDGGAHGVRDQALDLDAVHAASKQGLQLNRIVD